MSAALVYLVFCICLHACSGRPLGFLDKQETAKGSIDQLSDKMYQKIETTLPDQSLMINSEEAERRKVEAQPRNNFPAAEKDRNESNDNKGKKVELIKTQELQLKTADLQAQKTKARQMTESSPSDNSTKESMVSEDNNVGEDIDVMDYAQPHRKPPIHNKLP